jgi:HTH-type transcriptional regulator/antitoxin HigA
MQESDIDKLLNSIFSEDSSVNIREMFNEKLEILNVSKTKVLSLLKIDKDVFEQIINGTAKQPNLIHIIKIANFLNIPIDKFIEVVLKNQSVENISSIEKAKNATFLLNNFDVKTLTKFGFFKSKSNTDELVKKVLSFFGFESIRDYQLELDKPLYSSVKRNFSDKMKDFWIKSAFQTFKVIDNPNDYDRNRLKDLIVKIKPYSQDLENGLFTVCKALYNVGVTVVFQDYLTTTQVKGATFFINDKPCVVLTNFGKIYPTLWFTLLHELHHVLFDFDLIKNNSFHLTGDADLFLVEEKADSFARDFYMSEEKFHFIKRYIKNPYMVSKFANENEIHVSMVYSFFTWYQDKIYGKKYYGAFKEFYPNYKVSLKKLSPLSWEEDSIKSAGERIKKILEIS